MKQNIISFVCGAIVCAVFFLLINSHNNKTTEALVKEYTITTTNSTYITNKIDIRNDNKYIFITNTITTSNDILTEHFKIEYPVRKHIYGVGIDIDTRANSTINFQYINKQKHGIQIGVGTSLTNISKLYFRLGYNYYF